MGAQKGVMGVQLHGVLVVFRRTYFNVYIQMI